MAYGQVMYGLRPSDVSLREVMYGLRPSEGRTAVGEGLAPPAVYPNRGLWTPTTWPSSMYTLGTRGVMRQVTS